MASVDVEQNTQEARDVNSRNGDFVKRGVMEGLGKFFLGTKLGRTALLTIGLGMAQKFGVIDVTKYVESIKSDMSTPLYLRVSSEQQKAMARDNTIGYYKLYFGDRWEEEMRTAGYGYMLESDYVEKGDE